MIDRPPASGSADAHAARRAAGRLLAAVLIAGAAGLAMGLRTADAAVPLPIPGPSYTIHLGANADTAGAGGYACQGCDGAITAADRSSAAGRPLSPVIVTIQAPGRPDRVYWRGLVGPSGDARRGLARTVTLAAPPPYEVTLHTPAPAGYTLCPNSPVSTIVPAGAFGLSTALDGAPLPVRGAGVSWHFWSCR